MEDIRTRPLSAIEVTRWRSLLPQALVFVYLIIGLLAFLAVPFLALRWMQAPFLGGFVEQTMLFNQAGPADWAVPQQGWTGAQLVSVAGQPVPDARALQAVLQAHAVGEALPVQVRLPDGRLALGDLPLLAFPAGAAFDYFYLPYLIGLVYLGVGVWVYAIRRRYAAGRAFAQFCASAALGLGLLFDLYTTHQFSWLWTIAVGLFGGSTIGLALLYPREDPLVLRRPLLAWVGPLLGLLLAAFALPLLSDLAQPRAYQLAWKLEYSYGLLALLFCVLWAYLRRQPRRWSNDQEQVRLVALAALISFSPIGLWLISASLGLAWAFSPYLLIPLLIFPILAGYSVQRYRMLQADLVLSLGVRYGLMALLVAVGYALIVSGLSLGLSSLLTPASPLLTGLIFFLLALALVPLRERTQRLVDQFFFRNKRAFQDRLQTFSGELTRMVDLPGILRILRRYVADALAPSRLHVYIYDPLLDQYVAAADESGRPTSELRFPMTSGLAIHLSDQRAPLLLNEYDALPPALEPDRARLSLLGALAFVPLPGRQRLSGWLALGPRLSGEPYTAPQLSFVEALCDQAALAIERAQVVANMENRVRELNALTRVAQGINITLALDDILELVYTQTTQLIPAGNFSILLYDKGQDLYQYAFFLEKDERLSQQESCPVPAGQALEQEVIHQRRAIRTADYSRECQKRAILTRQGKVSAWMSVPLNAGAETIGALSLGSLDPVVEYTPEQQAMLQAIADQVAGALVKARLLQETQRRTRQLTTLNEVTRQLTSTLETEPLLQSILQSACTMLNCEAGSLLLVDLAADELVFRSVVGPVAGTLLNKRMPAGRGVVGKSVKTAQPIIVNDVNRFPEWFSKPDQDTGFVTHAVLVIPLLVKDRVIGVLEVINKRDGSIFSNEDLELLSAFASQAAVAIENARLYTNTDQALAERVEELSVMQRIDRELNASLDTRRAMSITLDWAMRQSGASAGIVGVIAENEPAGIQIMAAQGYDSELEAYQNALLSAGEYQFQEVINSGLPLHRSLDGAGNPRPLLENGHSQAVLPLRRETNTIGVLLLESTRPEQFSDEMMNFLIRLSDHASIAISNAQLYAAVQQANLAKSDFVSFVAHELKNPMTSVKGYTELIAAGAVGPITEPQANFLSTIRANIERMNTLVSDLNDSAKIEVGRLRLDFKALRLSDAIETAVRSTRKQIEEKQQVLNLELPADLPPVWADRTRLEQVLVNLLSNAQKYTPAEGSLEIAAEYCKNEWDANGAAEVVHIWVKDNGIGIAEEDQKKIFQKFFRSEDPKTREVNGTGLGLNITKSLVEMQGGKIWFESEFRKGTTFHFTVPISEI